MPKVGAKIDRQVTIMINFVNSGIKKWNAQRTKENQESLALEVKVSRNPVDRARNADQQAKVIQKNRSWVCNSSHMTNSARHVLIFYQGDIAWDLNALRKKIGKNEYAFLISLYAMGINRAKLCNYTGSPGFTPDGGDPYHVELSQSRVEKSDPEVGKCLAIYAQMTRVDGMKKNNQFERTNTFKRFIKKYDAKMLKTMP